jgi:DNA processing protein
VQLADELFLISARGLGARRALELRRALGASNDGAAPVTGATPNALHRLAQTVSAGRRRPIFHWPDPQLTLRQARRLEALGASIVWLGESGYPARVAEGLGAAAPAWLIVVGERERLDARSCAVIGSRSAAPEFCQAAFRLSRALAEAGAAVASGLAPGIDSAAHAGAVQGAAGAIAVPARGLLKFAPMDGAGEVGDFTLVGVGRPEDSFSAGLAIQRNYVIAALAGGVALAASGLRGGSNYAVRWAIERGRPVWCFEAGARTPEGNRALLNSGLARPLRIKAPPEAWAAEIAADLERAAANPRERRAKTSQLELTA